MGIATAKKNRLAMLKVAKDKAQDEVKAYEEEKAEQFKAHAGAKAAADPAAALKDSTAKEVAAVNPDYEKNKARTVQFICDKVLDVPIGLTETQTQSIKIGTV